MRGLRPSGPQLHGFVGEWAIGARDRRFGIPRPRGDISPAVGNLVSRLPRVLGDVNPFLAEVEVLNRRVKEDWTDRMSSVTDTTVARLLSDVQRGDRAALDELLPLVYEELRALAHHHRRRWQGDETLGTTALVHEAYLKLVGQGRIQAESRVHFLAVAAKAMRHILSNYARERRASKRGGGLAPIPFDESKLTPGQAALPLEDASELAALDEALRALEQLDPRQGNVVECRFFGGMTIDETAAALGVSARTVKRDWTVAQAWLQRKMEELDG